VDTAIGKIEEIRATPISSLCEVRIGNAILYLNPQGDFLMRGQLVDKRNKRKLAIFADPNCGYCKRFEHDLGAVTEA